MSETSSSRRFALALFLLSTAAVLFSLSVFRLISFFIMPSIFFDLLLVCFPIGAALAVLWRGDAFQRFKVALPGLQVAMVGTILATLSLEHFDYMRDNLLFDQSPFNLFVQIAIFALLYSPFFLVYGATEYLGYLSGREALERRMNGVYALVLLGAAAAFLVSMLQEWIGITRLLVASIGLITVSKAILLPKQRVRRFTELALIIAVLAWPQTDRAFMSLFKSNKNFSVAEYIESFSKIRNPDGTPVRVESLHAGWGRYSYFEVLEIEGTENHVLWGFYNDMSQWAYHPGKSPKPGFRESVLQPFLQGAESVAVVGSGGGRDVKLARESQVERILALDVEPALQRVVNGKLRDSFENVYSQDGVKLQIGDARTFLEHHTEKYDAIFFWSVGGYPQLMLEPGNMIRTQESLTLLLSRLTPDGCFFMGYDRALDPDMVLLKQYATTLQAAGAQVVAFEHGDPSIEFALVAFSPEADKEQLAKWQERIASVPSDVGTEPIRRIPDQELIQDSFSPVTDDRPYLGGNIRSVLSPENVRSLFYLIAVSLAVVVGLVWWLLPTGTNGITPPPTVQGLSVLLGMNFILLEHLVVLEIFRTSYIYADALMAGMVVFLSVTAIGSAILPHRRIKSAIMLSWVGPVIWLAIPSLSGSWIAMAALLVATLVTGNLFPTLFEKNPSSRLHIFALDAFGAAIGAMIAFFVPILFGLTALRSIALLIYLITSIAMLVSRRLDVSEPESKSRETGSKSVAASSS